MNPDQPIKPDGVPTSESAGGVATRIEDNRIMIVLIQEPELDGYVLPKGHIEEGETIEQAAKREVQEETGLTKLETLDKLGSLERMNVAGTEWKIIHYYLFKTTESELLEEKRTDDIEGADWFPLDNLPKMYWPEQEQLILENKEKINELFLKP